ncbi:MAG: A/G-specific adenine glycosylase [Clostridia bacterium]|nr:A/G-specific adenine glycosylase [Lachnospiraceae bacterium]NCB99270.1 A/G-specific adenine glycosylase [Clostridia bacterium]NCD01419.1 A/G-specific adenine glycosylase [Clostridia bacterium]
MSNLMRIKEFQNNLCIWYFAHGRDLPWRHTADPYSIWVSEIMLQQTQVDTVKSYYISFLEKLPDIKSLADVDEDSLFKLWEGLGYYRRVRNMQEAARQIMDDYNGVFPEHYKDIIQLKGIGPYTASAISSIAFSQEKGVVDGNTLRILSRIYNRQDNIALDKTKKAYQILMDELIKGSSPSYFNQAMMDLGALICTPKKTNCEHCPVQSLCEAKAAGTEALLPVNIKNNSKTDLYYITAILKKDNKYLLIKNKEGLLENLYAFVQYEVESPISFEEAFYENYGVPVRLTEYCKEIKHVFSHRVWHMNVYIGEITDSGTELDDYLYSEDEIADLPVSTAHRKVYNLR